MDIVFVSTFRAPCGIATYTEDLAAAVLALGGHRVTVLAEQIRGPEPKVTSPIACLRQWLRGSAYESQSGLGAVARSILGSKRRPDVVHVQHEFGLFPRSADLWRFVDELQTAHVKVCLTMHTVPKELRIFRTACCPNVIVHTLAGYAYLTIHAPSWKLTTIPHGTYLRAQTSVDPSRSVILCPGFVSPSKGHVEIIHAFAKAISISRNQLRTKLRIVGLCRDDNYRQRLMSTIAQLDIEEDIEFVEGFVDSVTMHRHYQEAQFVILGNDKGSPYSASGQLHTAAGYGLPILAKRVPIYDEPCAIKYDNKHELANLILAFDHTAVRDQASLASHIFASQRSWKHVADHHLRVYSGLS